jgi:hypothetical protein
MRVSKGQPTQKERSCEKVPITHKVTQETSHVENALKNIYHGIFGKPTGAGKPAETGKAAAAGKPTSADKAARHPQNNAATLNR